MIGLLGPIEVDGREISAAKPRTLLAVLALSPRRTVPVSVLAGALWGTAPPARAMNQIQGYVVRLRRLLGGDALVTRTPGYRLDADDLDTRRFQHLVTAGRRALGEGKAEVAAARLAEGLALWRGPALADVPDSPVIAAQAARLEELRLVALELRGEAELLRGRYQELVAELRVLVAAHPLRERLQGQLMTALFGAGRQAEALDAYDRARRALGELGLAPGPDLRQVQRAVLLGDAGLLEPRGPGLPAVPGTPAVGRAGGTADLDRRYAALSDAAAGTLRRMAAIRLAQFPGWCVAAAMGRTGADDVIDELAGAGLLDVARTDQFGDPWYRIPSLVRLFMGEHVTEESPHDVRDAVRNVLEWSTRLVEGVLDRPGLDLESWVAAEGPALVDGLRTACDSGWPELAGALAGSLTRLAFPPSPGRACGIFAGSGSAPGCPCAPLWSSGFSGSSAG